MMRLLLRVLVHGPSACLGVAKRRFPGARTRAAFAARARAFLADTRAGATAIAVAAVTVMTVGATALITDHVWLVDQRDVLKTASDAAGLAVTLQMERELAADATLTAAALKTKLTPVAEDWVEVNLQHLPSARLQRALDTLEVTVAIDLASRTVAVDAKADLGGTLMARAMPLLGSYAGPAKVAAKSQSQREVAPVEVVLAIDVSTSLAYKVGTERRIDIVKRAAKNMVDILGPSAASKVAVGVVPWNDSVCLSSTDRTTWTNSTNRWAVYPTKRRYEVPYHRLDEATPAAVEDTIPATPPETWDGCLDAERVVEGVAKLPARTAAALFATPAASPFAQGFYRPDFNARYSNVTCDATDLTKYSYGGCWEDQDDDEAQMWIEHAQFNKSDLGSIPAITPLTSNAVTARAAIDALDATGKSNFNYSPLGVLWGQGMLEHAWKTAGVWSTGGIHPVNPDGEGNAGTRKIIILLTDGLDENSCDDVDQATAPDCTGSKVSLARSNVCTQAKARGTEIFVIAPLEASERTSDAIGGELRRCSSDDPDDPDDQYVFLDSTTKETLESAFSNIARQLKKLRKVS